MTRIPGELYENLNNAAMENGLLACALTDPDAFLLEVSPADFHDQQLSQIWAAGQELVQRGIYADSTLIQETLRERGHEVPLSRIAQLLTMDVFSPSASAYAAKVRDMARRRKHKAVIDGALGEAYRAIHQSNETYEQELVEAADRLAKSLAPTKSNGDLASWDDIERVLSPITFDWNRWLAPGFLCVLVGSSGDGKSNLILRCVGTYIAGWAWPDGCCIVVDSFSAARRGREKGEEVMPVVKWLAALARDTGKPVVVLHHLRKRGVLDSGTEIDLDRVRGSTVIVQLARLVWAIDRPNPNDSEHKRLYVIKSNLSKPPAAVGLWIRDEGLVFNEPPETPEVDTALGRAVDLLRVLLAPGPMAATDLQEEAKGAGISWDTMKRAKDQLRIAPKRDGKKRKWYWALPIIEDEETAQD